MAQTIKIKRSASSAAPSSLGAGELAYSSNSKKLFVGHPSTSAVTTIGGDLYVQMLDHTAGTLTASSAVLVDGNSKIDQLKSGNIVITGSSNTISTASGNLTIAPTGNLVVTHGGTLDLSGQANSLTLLDNNAAALDINQGGTSYLKFVTTNGSESTTVGSALSVAGLSSLAGVNMTGNLAIATNKFTVNASSGNVVAAGTITGTDVTASGDLEVTGGTTLNGAVNIGNASGDTITVAGTTTFTPSVDFDGGFTVAGSQTIDLGGNRVTNIGTPTQATDASTKAYVDSVKQALDIKDSCRVATEAAISGTYNNGTSGVGATLTYGSNGAISVDGVTLIANNRVLVKDQSDATQNGIYFVSTVGDGSNAAVLTRALDADSSADVTGGLFTFIEEGSTNADAGFVLSNVTGSATLGTTDIGFTQFSGAGSVTAGNGLGKSGNTISVNVDNTSIELVSDTIQIKGLDNAISEGQMIFGANGGNQFTTLNIGTYDSTNSVGQMLQVGANGTIAWSNTLDGGTF
tara:strand:+ start:1843 stop:3399 length:1557 start_codon:yes stop_codon:yes gene_type:complete